MHATVTVTVMDGATVFEGTDTTYRYDITGAAIADGAALDDAVELIKELSGGQWPNCTVGLVADPSGTETTRSALVTLMRHLRLSGVTVLSAGQLDDYTAPATDEFFPVSPDDDDVSEVAEEKVGSLGRSDDPVPAVRIVDKPSQKRRLEPFHALVAVVVVALIGVSLWAVGIFSRDTQTQAAPATDTVSTSAVLPSTTESVPASVPTSEAAAPTTADTGVLLERSGLRVTLPRGFDTSEEDGLVTATGEDPDLRVLLAADPLYSVPAQALFAELREEIAGDPTLDLPEEKDGKFSYVENPGDDSQVTWTTWVADGQQMSVGCHSRQEPTRAHRAACRMAVDSLTKAS